MISLQATASSLQDVLLVFNTLIIAAKARRHATSPLTAHPEPACPNPCTDPIRPSPPASASPEAPSKTPRSSSRVRSAGSTTSPRRGSVASAKPQYTAAAAAAVRRLSAFGSLPDHAHLTTRPPPAIAAAAPARTKRASSCPSAGAPPPGLRSRRGPSFRGPLRTVTWRPRRPRTCWRRCTPGCTASRPRRHQ